MAVSLLVLSLVLLYHQTASNPCGPSWQGKYCKCYYLSDSYLDWNEAGEACKAMDSMLVSILWQGELDFINSMDFGNDSSFWTGLTYVEIDKNWNYVDGREANFVKWVSEQPKDEPDAHCAELIRSEGQEAPTESRYNTTSCALPKRYVCKKKLEIQLALDEDLASPDIYPQSSSAILYWKNWVYFEECSRSLWLWSKGSYPHVVIDGPNQTSDFSYQIEDLQPQTLYSYIAAPSGGQFAKEIDFTTTRQPLDNESSVIDVSCDSGWEMFNCKCYKLSTEKTTWTLARSMCQGMGAELVSIHSEEEQRFVSSIHSAQVWIGLNDISRERSYEWSDGSPYAFRYWHAGEPNRGWNEDCIENAKWGTVTKWNDVSCSVKWQYICEKSVTIKEVTPPTVHAESRQTVMYFQESSACLKMEVINKRTMEQWILGGDSNEYTLTIDNLPPEQLQLFDITPVLQSREELQLETKTAFLTPACDNCELTEDDLEKGCPAVFECPTGWVSKGCYCYKLMDTAMTWEDAADMCYWEQADLLTIWSMEEQQFVDEYISEEEIWLGLSDTETENTFRWKDDSSLYFTYWEQSQPDNGGERPERGEETPGSGDGYGSGYSEENYGSYYDSEAPYDSESFYGSESFLDESGSGSGSGMYITDDEDTSNAEDGLLEEDCVVKGSVYKNDGRWMDIDCKETRRVVCKKNAELTSVIRPRVFVQESMVEIQWEGKCKCPVSLEIQYTEERTNDNERSKSETHVKHFVNESYMADDMFGLDPLTMYKIDIMAKSDKAEVRENAHTTLLFRTPGSYPEPTQTISSTPRYEDVTPKLTTSSKSTTYPPFSPIFPSVSSPSSGSCAASPSSAVAFSFSMSCGEDNKPGTHLSYTFMNADGLHTEWQMLCGASDTSGSTMTCSTSSSPVAP